MAPKLSKAPSGAGQILRATVLSVIGMVAVPKSAEAGKPDLCVQAGTPEEQMLHTKYGADGEADGEGGAEQMLKEWKSDAGVDAYKDIPEINQKVETACQLDCSQDAPVEFEVSTDLIPMDQRIKGSEGVFDIDFCREAFDDLIKGEPPVQVTEEGEEEGGREDEGEEEGGREDEGEEETGDGDDVCTLEEGECELKRGEDNSPGLPEGSFTAKAFDPEDPSCWKDVICHPADQVPVGLREDCGQVGQPICEGEDQCIDSLPVNGVCIVPTPAAAPTTPASTPSEDECCAPDCGDVVINVLNERVALILGGFLALSALGGTALYKKLKTR